MPSSNLALAARRLLRPSATSTIIRRSAPTTTAAVVNSNNAKSISRNSMLNMQKLQFSSSASVAHKVTEEDLKKAEQGIKPLKKADWDPEKILGKKILTLSKEWTG
jgi:hypothetical protein